MLLNFLKKQDINKGIIDFNSTNDAILLDVRSKDEYHEGHIPSSKNIDIESIDNAAFEIANKDTPIFVYCYSGSRSSIAVNALKEMGYQNVKNIGGISFYTGNIEKGN